MLNNVFSMLANMLPVEEVSAHCDGPCGVYDPASARIAAEAVVSMTKKINALPSYGSVATANTMSRYIAIKEEQAHLAKSELLVLWTDYFKPVHLDAHPDLHTTFWNAAKLCSACKVEVSEQHADELMDAIENIHNIFWATKGRTDVPFYRAG
ncbi:MAG: superoxide dismutase, Ni [Chloroflexota bacterium]